MNAVHIVLISDAIWSVSPNGAGEATLIDRQDRLSPRGRVCRLAHARLIASEASRCWAIRNPSSGGRSMKLGITLVGDEMDREDEGPVEIRDSPCRECFSGGPLICGVRGSFSDVIDRRLPHGRA